MVQTTQTLVKLPTPNDGKKYRVPGASDITVSPYADDDGAFVGIDNNTTGLTLPVHEARAVAAAILAAADVSERESKSKVVVSPQ